MDVQFGYSEWFPVPESRTTWVNEIVNDRKFQLRTDMKISDENKLTVYFRYLKFTGLTWFTLRGRGRMQAFQCKDSTSRDIEVISPNAPFYQRAGDLTFLKTSTQLQIWCDHVLEGTWIYEDEDADKTCSMKMEAKGMRFHYYRAATHYRYQLGKQYTCRLYVATDYQNTIYIKDECLNIEYENSNQQV